MQTFRTWLILAVAVAPTLTVAETHRTLVLIDASASLRSSDPLEFRKVATELLIDLAQDGDFMAISQFHGEVADISGGFLRIGDVGAREKLKEAARTLADDGKRTDFGAALLAAVDTFKTPADPDEKRFVLLLTDGRCDPSPNEPRYAPEKPGAKRTPYERDERCKEFVIKDVLPNLIGVEVMAIGLSPAAPREFLEELAKRTSGHVELAVRGDDLPRLFAKIHALNFGSRLQTPTNMEIQIDPAAQLADIVVMMKSELDAAIRKPDGTALEPAPPTVLESRHPRYKHLRVQTPAAGKWSVKPTAPIPPGSILVIQTFDMTVILEVPTEVAYGNTLMVSARLAGREGTPPPEVSFLERHRFFIDVREPDGKARTLEMERGEKGARVVRIPTLAAGTVELVGRVEPGPLGVITRASAPYKVNVTAPVGAQKVAPAVPPQIEKPAAKPSIIQAYGGKLLAVLVAVAVVYGLRRFRRSR